MTIEVTSTVLDALLDEARAKYPQEACGLLFASGAVIDRAEPAANIHPTPETHFEIAPQALIDAHRAVRNGGPRLVGYYHSHPQGPPEPSATDRALAAGDGMIWAIVSANPNGGRVTWWRAGRDGMTPLPIQTRDA